MEQMRDKGFEGQFGRSEATSDALDPAFEAALYNIMKGSALKALRNLSIQATSEWRREGFNYLSTNFTFYPGIFEIGFLSLKLLIPLNSWNRDLFQE